LQTIAVQYDALQCKQHMLWRSASHTKLPYNKESFINYVTLGGGRRDLSSATFCDREGRGLVDVYVPKPIYPTHHTK